MSDQEYLCQSHAHQHDRDQQLHEFRRRGRHTDLNAAYVQSKKDSASGAVTLTNNVPVPVFQGRGTQ